MEDELQAFARRSALQRSPQQQQMAPLQMAPASQSPSSESEAPNTLKGTIQQIGAALEGLTALFGGQRHINALMREELAKLVKLHSAAESFCDRRLKNCEVQTSPPKTNGQLKGAHMIGPIGNNTPKRSREVSAEQRKTPSKKSKLNKESVVGVKPKTNRENPKQAGKTNDENWTMVKGRKPVHKRPRSDAIAISGVEGCSYADMLRVVRTDPSLKHLSGDVQGIRKTAKGDLLLQLSRKPEHSAEVLQEAVGKALGERAVVKTLTETAPIEIRDLDELVTKEELIEAVKEALKDSTLTMDAIKSLRPAFAGQQRATVVLPAGKARALLELAKIRVGWVVCRIRAADQPKRCFKCQDYGHIAANCTNDCDLKGACFRCGTMGHAAKTCVKPPKCCLCSRKGEKQTDHATGSFKCPTYREAVRKMKC